MGQIDFGKDETIFSQGDPSEHCYKIISGSVEIRLKRAGVMNRSRFQPIAKCGPGEMIGEMSLIDRSSRSATAVAIEPTVCQAYTESEIMNLLQNYPEEALNYVRTLIRRVRSSNRKVSWSAGDG